MGYLDNSVGKGVCHQVWQPKIEPGTHILEEDPTSCPLTSAILSTHMSTRTHTHIHTHQFKAFLKKLYFSFCCVHECPYVCGHLYDIACLWRLREKCAGIGSLFLPCGAQLSNGSSGQQAPTLGWIILMVHKKIVFFFKGRYGSVHL